MKHADRKPQRALRRTARRRGGMENTAPVDRRWVEAKDVHLADEVRYIQRLAARRDSRIVTIGQFLLFSTESGDAWILDPADHLASRIAETGDPRTVHIVETEKSFEVGWRGRYEIIGSAFVFSDDESGRTTTILGYPTREITGRIADVLG